MIDSRHIVQETINPLTEDELKQIIGGCWGCSVVDAVGAAVKAIIHML